MTIESMGSIQRELDGLQRHVEDRFKELTALLDKTVSLLEYRADQKITDLRFTGMQDDVSELKNFMNRLETQFQRDFKALQEALIAEGEARRKAFQDEEANDSKKEYETRRSRREKTFFFIGIVVPSIVTLVATLIQVFK